MNKQNKGNGRRGIEWTDFTWNPVGGCRHACRWTMPDGSEAICYAETQAERQRSDRFYPHGFEHHYWHPERLDAPLKVKEPSRIFLDSMSDLMGNWVAASEIEAVLDVARRAPQHSFQLLTKNAPRLLKFEFPSNVWVGVSAPPSHFMGKPLSAEQQRRYVFRAMEILRDVDATVRWFSIEPLSFDIANVFTEWSARNPVETKRNGAWIPSTTLPLEWAVIGAATNGSKVYQPKPEWVENILGLLDGDNIPVFFKGNLKSNSAAEPWREEFPK